MNLLCDYNFAIGWQQQYGNDPYEILKSRGFYIDEELKNRIRGSEAAMWSEQVLEMLGYS